jgi:hypothetical protein
MFFQRVQNKKFFGIILWFIVIISFWVHKRLLPSQIVSILNPSCYIRTDWFTNWINKKDIQQTKGYQLSLYWDTESSEFSQLDHASNIIVMCWVNYKWLYKYFLLSEDNKSYLDTNNFKTILSYTVKYLIYYTLLFYTIFISIWLFFDTKFNSQISTLEKKSEANNYFLKIAITIFLICMTWFLSALYLP